MAIRIATRADIPLIQELAHKIWWHTYRDILAAQQISLMLEDMYSEEALRRQFSNGDTFLIAGNQEEVSAGFASFSITRQDEILIKIHKLYLLPSEQGKGVGTALLNSIRLIAMQQGATAIQLNVNRRNPALSFYKKAGFFIHQEVDIPYFGFILDDYVMRLSLR